MAAGSTAASGGAGSPVTIPFMAMLAAMIPATAYAGKGVSNQDESCVNDSCKTAKEIHLTAINVFGREHSYKESYGFRKVKFYDICACDKGAITIAEGAGKCGRVQSYAAITYERWKDPVVPWDGN